MHRVFWRYRPLGCKWRDRTFWSKRRYRPLGCKWRYRPLGCKWCDGTHRRGFQSDWSYRSLWSHRGVWNVVYRCDRLHRTHGTFDQWREW